MERATALERGSSSGTPERLIVKADKLFITIKTCQKDVASPDLDFGKVTLQANQPWRLSSHFTSELN